MQMSSPLRLSAEPQKNEDDPPQAIRPTRPIQKPDHQLTEENRIEGPH